MIKNKCNTLTPWQLAACIPYKVIKISESGHQCSQTKFQWLNNIKCLSAKRCATKFKFVAKGLYRVINQFSLDIITDLMVKMKFSKSFI